MIESWNDLRQLANGPIDMSSDANTPDAIRRSRWRASRALVDYQDTVSGNAGSFDESLSDLLADLLHLADELDVDASAVVDTGQRNYDAERRCVCGLCVRGECGPCPS